MVFQRIPSPSDNVDPHTRKPVFVPGPMEDYGNNIPRPQNVSLEAPTYFEEPGLSVETGEAPPSYFDEETFNSIPIQEVANVRAQRYDFAMGEVSPGEEAIFNDLMTGGEDNTRARASVEERMQLNQRRQKLIQNYLTNLPNGEITADKINQLYEMDKGEVDEAYANPSTFYERKFAKKSAEIRTAEYLDELGGEDRGVKDALNRASGDILTKQGIARKLFEDGETAMKDRTWGDVFTSFVPFHAWLTMSSAMGQDEGFLLGEKMKNQIINAYKMSPDEFERTQKEVFNQLKETDPAYAMQYAAALLGYSASDEFLNNAWSAADLSMFTPGSMLAMGALSGATGKAAYQGAKEFAANIRMINAHNALKTMTKNMAGNNLDYLAMLPETRRAQQAAVDSLRAKAMRTGYQTDWAAIEGTVQDLFNPSRVLTGAKNMTAEEAARIEVSLLRSSTTALNELIMKPRTLARLSGREQSVALAQAANYLDRMYSNTTLGSRVVRIAGANHEIVAAETLTGTDYIAVHIGTKDLKGYATEATAKAAANKMGLKKYTIENIDGGNYIKFYHSVDETDSTLRAFRDPTNKYADKPHLPFIHGVMSRLRMRDSLIPDQLSEDFKFAQSATNLYFEKNRAQFISDFDGLPKKSRQELDAFMERERDYRLQVGPNTDPNAVTRGRYAKNVGELQQNFEKEMGRPITPDEVRAYFSWKSWNDVDYAVRNLDLARDKSRLGIQAINLRARAAGATDSQWTANIEGKVLLDFPWDRKGDAGILVWDAAEPWKMTTLRKNFVSNAQGGEKALKDFDLNKPSPGQNTLDKRFYTRAHIDDLIKNKGYRVVHLSPYSKRTLTDFLDNLGPEGQPKPTGSADGTPVHRQMVNALKEDDVYSKARNRQGEYADLSAAATTESDQDFYRLMAWNSRFRQYFEGRGIPTTPLERANATLDWAVSRKLPGEYAVPKALDGRFFSLYNKKYREGQEITEADLGKPITTNSDKVLPGEDKLPKRTSGDYTPEEREIIRAFFKEHLPDYTFNFAQSRKIRFNEPRADLNDPKKPMSAVSLDRAVKFAREETRRVATSEPTAVAAELPEVPLLSPKALTDFKSVIRKLDPEITVNYSKGRFTLKKGSPEGPQTLVDKGTMDDVVNYFERTNAINEPATVPGKIRIYHSGGPENTGPRWVSTDREYASNYRGDQPLWYTDLDAADPRVNNPDYPEQNTKAGFTFNFELPEAEAQQMRQINREAGKATTSTPKSVASSGDFSVGDSVYPLAADKSRLTTDAQKITAIYEDPKFGTYVQTEGQPSFVPISQVEMVSKKAKVSPLVPEGNGPTGINLDDYPEMKKYEGIDYILVKQEEDMRTAAMDLISFPYQEGGHRLDMDSYFYIRQPQVYFRKEGQSVISTYTGDANAFSAVLETDAKGFRDRLEQIRMMLADDVSNGTNNAEHYYIRNMDGVSKSFKDFREQFKEINPNGYLSLKHPFVVTPRNKSTWDFIRSDIKDSKGNLTYPNLENARDSEHNLFHNELNMQYALNRSDNLEKVVQKGTSDYPVYGTELQSNLSPMATLINTTSDLIRGRVLDDLKIKSAENFGRAYNSVIDAPAELVRRDPMQFILTPQWKKGLIGEELKLLNAAKDYRRSLIDFLGVENNTRDFMTQMQRTVADEIKGKLGQKSYDWVDRHMLRGKYVDPIRWANNMVFDLFFGVYNIKQLAVQAMTAYHPIAVNPRHGLPSAIAAIPARWLLHNDDPAKAALIGSRLQAAKIMKKDHFIEALQAYKDSGWHIIGGETAMQDDFINTSIKESFFDRQRSAARFFYREGDRYARTVGWFTSYSDWRAANPTAKLTPQIKNEILARADDLTLNMSAASNSVLASGVGSIPLKFTTYYARFMEQMLPGWTGSKLSPRERARAYIMYTTMFGAPITAGGVAGVWPFYKEWAKIMNENGINADENMVYKAFNEGALGVFSQVTGLNQNFSEALGPTGSPFFYDIYNGKTPLFDLVMGVGGTKLEDTFESTWPFFTFVANAFRTDDEKYPLDWSDLENLVRSVSSVNQVWRSIQMYNLGVYMSKNRTPLKQGVDGVDAAMSLLFGTVPSDLSAAFIKGDMTQATNDMKKAAKKDIVKYYRLQMKAMIEQDIDGVTHYGKIIKGLIEMNGFMPDEMNSLFTDSTSEAGDYVTKANKVFNESTPERQQMFLDKQRKNKREEEQK